MVRLLLFNLEILVLSLDTPGLANVESYPKLHESLQGRLGGGGAICEKLRFKFGCTQKLEN